MSAAHRALPAEDRPPPAGVLDAYGVTAAEPVWMGGAWRAGNLVLKRVGFLPEARWRAGVLAALPPRPRSGCLVRWRGRTVRG
ncbi:hypothetical protein ACFQ0B_40285 [Nonomuraea thailandensis]